MCVAVSAFEGFDVSGVVGAFACPGVITAHAVSTTLLPFASVWAVPVLMAKLSNEGKMYRISPLQPESYSIVQCYVHPSVVTAKTYGRITVIFDGGCFFVRKIKGSATLSVVCITVDVWRHFARCRAISDVLHDLLP